MQVTLSDALSTGDVPQEADGLWPCELVAITRYTLETLKTNLLTTEPGARVTIAAIEETLMALPIDLQ